MSLTRVRALVVVAVLAVAALIVVVMAVVRDTQAAPAAGCPAGAVVANLTLPNPPQVTVKVFNGSKVAGLADSVTTEFRNRKFKTEKPAENKKKINDVAVLRYGPEAVGAAWTIRAYFLNRALVQYDAERKGAVVDIVIGRGFQQLATFTEANQSMGALGEPKLPLGACAATTL